MKIPDDVYEGRCRYCIQYTGEENGEIPDEKVFVPYYSQKAACRILGIAQCGKVPGECLSFAPKPIFGICKYCEYTNSFTEGYCMAPGGPKGKRRVYLGCSVGGSYYADHALFTCKKYKVSSRWKDLILAGVLKGRGPACFDPETWEPLQKLEGTPQAAEWAKLREKEQEKLREERKKKAAAEDVDGQLRLL